MRHIKIATALAAGSEWRAAKTIGARWPRSFRVAQELLAVTEKSISGRRGLFSRKPPKGEVETILRELDDVLEKEGFGRGEPWFPSDGAERVFRFLSEFSAAFPNWRSEYLFLEEVIRKTLTAGRSPSAKNDVAEALEVIRQFIIDEEFQNELLPDVSRASILSGTAVDTVPGASGIFGKTASNPIPVNGVLGEITYLSRLRTPNGQRLLAHRIGTAGTIDVYETVSFDGKNWDRIYLDLYHPRKSRLVPAGYDFVSRPSEIDLLTAVNVKLEDFPAQMPDALRRCAAEFGVPAWMPASEAKAVVERVGFPRPLCQPTTVPSYSDPDRDGSWMARRLDANRTIALASAVIVSAEDTYGDIYTMLGTGGRSVEVPMEKVFASALRAALAGAVVAGRRAGLPYSDEEQYANLLAAAVRLPLLDPEMRDAGFSHFSMAERHAISNQLFWPCPERGVFFRQGATRSDNADALAVRLEGAAVIDGIGSLFGLSTDDRARLSQMALAFRILFSLQAAFDSCESILAGRCV